MSTGFRPIYRYDRYDQRLLGSRRSKDLRRDSANNFQNIKVAVRLNFHGQISYIIFEYLPFDSLTRYISTIVRLSNVGLVSRVEMKPRLSRVCCASCVNLLMNGAERFVVSARGTESGFSDVLFVNILRLE